MSKCKTEVFARVTGFFTPVKRFNPGKGVNGEFGERKKFNKSIADYVSKTAHDDMPK